MFFMHWLDRFQCFKKIPVFLYCHPEKNNIRGTRLQARCMHGYLDGVRQGRLVTVKST